MNYFMIDNLVYGGAERQATYLLNNHLNFEKIILLENVKKYDLQTNIPICALNPSILNVTKRLIGDRNSKKSLEDTFTSTDTVVSFLERSNLINIKSSIKTKHKSIISVRNYLSERYRDHKYIYRMSQIKKYYPKADLIIANSEESKNDLVNNFNIPVEKVKVIYNLIDMEKVQSQKQEEIAECHREIFKKPVILTIGSLIPQKCQKQLIEAFKSIKDLYSEYKLVIIGSGKQESRLLKTISDLDLQNEVYLIGNVKNPFKYLMKADVFVLNSVFEGFPNVLLESLAVGTPVVTKNCLSGPAEMLGVMNYENVNIQLTKYGYIFPKLSRGISNYYIREKEYLAESISKLIDLKKNDNKTYQKMSKDCKNRAQDFNEKNIIDQWKKIIN